MGILSGLLLLPLAPLRGTIWIAERLAEYAESELSDERAIRRLLVEAEAAVDSGELTEAEFDEIEDALLDRLDTIRAAAAVEGAG
jgi:Gas vesicle protein G